MTTPTKVILLACGSFNPPTNMHLRMFEVARDHLHRLGNYVVIGGLISPVHDGYGKKELVAATHRISMIKLALQNSDWIQLSDWECKQETWIRTRNILQYHQNYINALANKCDLGFNENDHEADWIPRNMKDGRGEPVQIKLICGADLLESFGVPGLWAEDDIETIVGQHGLVVVTRDQTSPLKFVYDSDILTKFMGNIIIVTEWIRNEISSSKIRKALRRSESVKYLIDDKVINYIHKYNLYGSKGIKYVLCSPSSFPTPSPEESTCYNSNYNNNFSINNVPCMPTNSKSLATEFDKRPGQAVKVTPPDGSGKSRVSKKKEVRGTDEKAESKKPTTRTGMSKSCSSFEKFDKILKIRQVQHAHDEKIKFMLTRRGIQVISDREAIV